MWKEQCNECGFKKTSIKKTLPLKKIQTEINEKFNDEFEIIGEFEVCTIYILLKEDGKEIE